MENVLTSIVTLALACIATQPLTAAPGAGTAAQPDPAVVQANSEFGFRMLRRLTADEPAKNVFLSPYSLSTALTLTANGAAGSTRANMLDTLGLKGVPVAKVNASNTSLLEWLNASRDGATLTTANSLWADDEVKLKPSYVRTGRDTFSAEVRNLDLQSATAPNIVNKWVSDRTQGMIPKLVDSFDPAERLSIINALYFKGSWAAKFDPKWTRVQPFHRADGSEQPVKMMSRTGEYGYLSVIDAGVLFAAARLPYKGDSVAMYVFVPQKETDLPAFLRELTPANWDSWMRSFHTTEVMVGLPRFKVRWRGELSPTLKALGMTEAFGGAADFSAMFDGPARPGLFQISDVIHEAVMEVDEEGTVAAAATKVGIRATAAMPRLLKVVADRPFFVAIRHEGTGEVLFVGAVYEPAALAR